MGRLFDNTSECYKFFWFKAILDKVLEGKNQITYEELVDIMIADAWYMVTEYHLNLGPKDTLENLVRYIKQKNPSIKPNEKKSKIIDFIRKTDDKEIIRAKRTLTYNVPYRLQAPFMQKVKGDEWKAGQSELIRKINQERRLIYYFEELQGLKTNIYVQEDWKKYITKNQEIIKGWLEYNMILYLQRRNPSVPGIADKIYPPQDRKLEKVKKYWKLIMSLEPVQDIYGGVLLTEKDISIDHFVPWSYVAHEEMWNLSPTTKSINSSKSNNLPDWDSYFDRLVKQEYQSYRLLWKYDVVHKEFDKCAREHINNEEIKYRIFRKDLGIEEFSNGLKSVILPVYQSAQNCGFGNWRYQGCLMKVYNKLVRDDIPRIIEADGKKCKTRILSDEDYIKALEEKLNEEVAEYQSDHNLEEMADILEVLQSICIARGYSLQELEEKRVEKARKRGNFKNKVFLEYVE